MARNRKKIAFYEAMTKAQLKSSYGRQVERLHQEKSDEDKRTSAKPESAIPGRAAKWWRKPRVVQFNAGKIEFSMSYPVAFAVVLGIILLILAAFRLGQAIPGPAGRIAESVPYEPVGRLITDTPQPVDEPERMAPVAASVSVAKTEPAPPKGANVIVLVEYQKRADLVPVQRHFARYGIQTEIVNWAGRYFLITKDRFEGFGAGSDGADAKSKIIEVGALYEGKAPEGYETFAPHFFRDAYGKKVE